MDGFDLGDMLGGLFGDAESAGGGEVVAGILGGLFGGGKREREPGEAVTYERYLCGGPKNLNINDR